MSQSRKYTLLKVIFWVKRKSSFPGTIPLGMHYIQRLSLPGSIPHGKLSLQKLSFPDLNCSWQKCSIPGSILHRNCSLRKRFFPGSILHRNCFCLNMSFPGTILSRKHSLQKLSFPGTIRRRNHSIQKLSLPGTIPYRKHSVQKLPFLGNVLYKNYFCQKVISQTCLRQPVFLSLIVFWRKFARACACRLYRSAGALSRSYSYVSSPASWRKLSICQVTSDSRHLDLQVCPMKLGMKSMQSFLLNSTYKWDPTKENQSWSMLLSEKRNQGVPLSLHGQFSFQLLALNRLRL